MTLQAMFCKKCFEQIFPREAYHCDGMCESCWAKEWKELKRVEEI